MAEKTRYNLKDNQVRAYNKLIRISMYKLSLVAGLIRGRMVADAVDVLKFSKKRVANEVLKTLLSAVANAENNKKLPSDSLFVKEIWVGKALTMKRFRAGPRGQAKPLLKPFSHLTIVLEAGTPSPKAKAPKVEKKPVEKKEAVTKTVKKETKTKDKK